MALHDFDCEGEVFLCVNRGERALGGEKRKGGRERARRKKQQKGLCCFCGVQAVLAPRATLKNTEHVGGEFKWYRSQTRTPFSPSS